MYATYVIKTNARSVLTRFTVGGSITDYIDDPAKGPPGEVSKLCFSFATERRVIFQSKYLSLNLRDTEFAKNQV